MKKLIIAFLLVVMVLMLPKSTAYADDVFAINGDDVIVLGGSYEARYQNNLEFMNRQFTDSKRQELLLRPSYDVDSNNKNVIALAKTITASLTDDYAKAQAIHDWVSNNIYYTNNDPFADYYSFVIDAKGERVLNGFGEAIFSQEASYVIESKRAYCEGYANLTCALLRAVGIPSLVYDGWALSDINSWGPHAWTGAYIKSQNKWIIMDTTYDSSNRYYDGEYRTEKARKAHFDADLPTFSKTHFNFTPIYAAHPDEDIDLDDDEYSNDDL